MKREAITWLCSMAIIGLLSASVGAQTAQSGADQIRLDVPEGWTHTRTDKKERAVEWRLEKNSNADVEIGLAAKYGLPPERFYDSNAVLSKEKRQALNDPAARDLAFVRVVVGPPPLIKYPDTVAPFGDADDVKAYLEKLKPHVNPHPAKVAGFTGYRYKSDRMLSYSIYELVMEPDELRLFISVFPSDSNHAQEIDAILNSITIATP